MLVRTGTHIWIARDSDGILKMYNDKPIRRNYPDDIGFWDTYTGEMELNPNWFKDIRWEDEPKEVIFVPNTGDTLEENFIWIARDDCDGDNLFAYTEYPRYVPVDHEFENISGFLHIHTDSYPEVKRGSAPSQSEIKLVNKHQNKSENGNEKLG